VTGVGAIDFFADDLSDDVVAVAAALERHVVKVLDHPAINLKVKR
jgi:hypothetical protein